jgi:hypothetical protein
MKKERKNSRCLFSFLVALNIDFCPFIKQKVLCEKAQEKSKKYPDLINCDNLSFFS